MEEIKIIKFVGKSKGKRYIKCQIGKKPKSKHRIILGSLGI